MFIHHAIFFRPRLVGMAKRRILVLANEEALKKFPRFNVGQAGRGVWLAGKMIGPIQIPKFPHIERY